MSATETKAARKCSHCGKEITEGYVIDGGDAYYCSDRCLEKRLSRTEYEEKYDGGEGDSYWTIFED